MFQVGIARWLPIGHALPNQCILTKWKLSTLTKKAMLLSSTWMILQLFDSVISLWGKLIKSFNDRAPSTLDFNVGYYEGSQQAKIWLVTDLKTFYQTFFNIGRVTLWCDGPVQETESTRKWKREPSSNTSVVHWQENEQNVKEAYKKLLENTPMLGTLLV